MNELMRTDNNAALMLQAAKQQVRAAQELEQKSAKFKNIEQIEHAAQDFEAVFISEVLKPMFEEINNPDPLFGGGHGEKVFNGMMLQEYGKLMAEQGGIGIASHVKAELMRIQEAHNQNEQGLAQQELK